MSLADAEKLDLARSVGTLSLVLRNQLDKSKVATTGISKQDLFKFKEAPRGRRALRPGADRRDAPPRAQDPGRGHPTGVATLCVEVIRNGTRA